MLLANLHKQKYEWDTRVSPESQIHCHINSTSSTNNRVPYQGCAQIVPRNPTGRFSRNQPPWPSQSPASSAFPDPRLPLSPFLANLSWPTWSACSRGGGGRVGPRCTKSAASLLGVRSFASQTDNLTQMTLIRSRAGHRAPGMGRANNTRCLAFSGFSHAVASSPPDMGRLTDQDWFETIWAATSTAEVVKSLCSVVLLSRIPAARQEGPRSVDWGPRLVAGEFLRCCSSTGTAWLFALSRSTQRAQWVPCKVSAASRAVALRGATARSEERRYAAASCYGRCLRCRRSLLSRPQLHPCCCASRHNACSSRSKTMRNWRGGMILRVGCKRCVGAWPLQMCPSR